jgi:hypothetical protein
MKSIRPATPKINRVKTAFGLAVGLVEVLVGTVVGAWLYREGTA